MLFRKIFQVKTLNLYRWMLSRGVIFKLILWKVLFIPLVICRNKCDEGILNAGDRCVNARNKEGKTALHYAIKNSNKEMMELLMSQEDIEEAEV